MRIDTRLDLATGYDRPKRHDPDRDSPILRRYHAILWSKELPNGVNFSLDATGPKSLYLVHDSSQLGRFVLSSDTITTRMTKKARRALSTIPEPQIPPHRGYTIGSSIIFPSNSIDGRRTINGERGCHPRINDRFDLTLECIRRHYAGERSPLADTLARYESFFALFESFDGYVDFFLLRDLVDEAGQIRWWLPFDDFASSGVPSDAESYLRFRHATLDFIEARNRQIQAWADRQLPAVPDVGR